jgi:signal transduction histidine kinase
MVMPNKHSILVVDDEPFVVKSLQDLLRYDYTVHGATRAAEALDILKHHDVQVVMTDQRMPEMTGVELLAQVKEKWPDAVRLLFTGYAEMRAVVDAINRGNVYRYITKPWNVDELQTIIRQACDRYDLVAERRQLLSELQHKNLELERANAELARANETKESFIQVASHELRTPLTILIGLTKLALRAESVKEPLHEWLTKIDSAAQRLQRLVEEILTMLSARQYGRELRKGQTDLAALCRFVVDDVRPFTVLRHQTFNVDLAADLGAAAVEPSRIRDSLNHLLLNAVKFTPDGGAITFAARREAEQVVFQVTDSGVGIPKADLPKIFTPFFTESNVSHHSSGQFEFLKRGIGLGLSIVKAFVEMHGGSISVQSEEGSGSTFTVRLPVSEPAPVAT